MFVRLKPLRRMLTTRGTALAHDVVMGSASMFLGLYLRLDMAAIQSRIVEYTSICIVFGCIVGAVGLAFGMNRGVWRYASLPDLIAIVKVASISIAIFIVAHFFLVRLEAVPRSSMGITWAFLIVLLASPRAMYRIYRNQRDSRRSPVAERLSHRRVLLIGASDNADLFLKTISERSGSAFDVLAIVDERGRRVGRFIRGVPVVGGFDNLPQILDRLRAQGKAPDALIMTRSRAEFERYVSIERLVELVSDQGLELLRLPNMLEMQEMNADVEVRPVRLEDLLQRAPIQLDTPRIAAMIRDRKVLITGAGGSIGSELVRQIAGFQPSELVLLDASEYLLYSIEQDVRVLCPQLNTTALLCNVREREAVERIMSKHRPEVVFHAAALKHVPMVEKQPMEGIFTNSIGTRNVAEAATQANVAAMVMLSTDKAVNPTSVMGATKRIAEMFCQTMDLSQKIGGTRFMTVRFGNVLGSAGSVVPLFEKQLKAGGPLTVTHADIERYFMTIPEACLLVLQSAAYGLANPNERGRIFVLDMGKPFKIADLARNLIRLSGLRPDIDIQIVYTGLRPGEKLYEELFDARETLVKTEADGIMMAFPRAIEPGLVFRIFNELQRLVEANDTPGALRLLCSTIPEYRPGNEMSAAMHGTVGPREAGGAGEGRAEKSRPGLEAVTPSNPLASRGDFDPISEKS